MCFDYGISPAKLGPVQRKAFDALAERVAEAGEPFRIFFTREELDEELRAAGFNQVRQHTPDQLNELYFAGRSDGLRLPTPGLAMLATAWVE